MRLIILAFVLFIAGCSTYLETRWQPFPHEPRTKKICNGKEEDGACAKATKREVFDVLKRTSPTGGW